MGKLVVMAFVKHIARYKMRGFLDCIDHAIAYLIKDTVAEVEKELDEESRRVKK